MINNRTYYLGQSFTSGLANPEVKKHSGNIIYVDNRPSITRSQIKKKILKSFCSSKKLCLNKPISM